MPSPIQIASAAQALAAELGAALPARKSALELERHYQAPDARGSQAHLQALAGAELRLSKMAPEADDHAVALARMAVPEAEALEQEADRLEALLQPGQIDKPASPLAIVAGLQWEARYGEGRARALLSARRKSLRLPGFDDALELEPEEELVFLALRRFTRFLHAGTAWPAAELDWLALRASTLPGRLRLHGAVLRSAAENVGRLPLPEALIEVRRPFIQFEYDPAPALAWGVAGFTVTEALAWGAAGFAWPVQALAWRAWGQKPKEAAAWAAANFMPDEAAAFNACGAKDPATARSLRHAFGDVENLLAWHRAGFASADILRFKSEGVREPEAALRLVRGAAKAAAEAAAPKPAPVAPPTAAPEQPKPRSKPKPAPSFGPDGGAWMGWGIVEATGEPVGPGDADACSRALGAAQADVLVASEGVALQALPHSLPSLQIGEDWQALLDAYRQSLGRERKPGRWWVCGLPPLKARIYWGLHFRSSISPWGKAIDFDSSETWQQRWKRKAEEFGEAGLNLPCEVTRTPAGGWCMVAKGSQSDFQGSEAQPLDLDGAPAEWSEAVDRFCLIMGIGRPAQAWHLLAVE